MILDSERCSVCPVTLEDLRNGGAETVCAACGGKREFNRYGISCLGKSQLDLKNRPVESFGELLASLNLLAAAPSTADTPDSLSTEGPRSFLWSSE